jgi:hypothetical protein
VAFVLRRRDRYICRGGGLPEAHVAGSNRTPTGNQNRTGPVFLVL